MIDELKWIVHLTEVEYKRGSFNGPAFMETVKKLSLEQACDTNTHDNFSAWSVVLHDAYFKWAVLDFFKPDEYSWPYERKSFPALPEQTQQNWDKTITLSDELHDAYIDLLKGLNQDDLEKTFPAWKCSMGEFIAWIATHDSYHVAQIRNMGVKDL